MISGISQVSTAAPLFLQRAQSLRTASSSVQFGSDSAPADGRKVDVSPRSWWQTFAKPMLRALFIYDLPSKNAINQLAKDFPDNKDAQTLKKHAKWSENTLRVLNWANWAMIATLPIPFVHFVTGPILLGTAVVEIGARIGLESYMHKRADKLASQLYPPISTPA